MSTASIDHGAAPMTAGGGLDDLPLERLETEITTLAGQISAATCRLLLAIASYDRREGWADWGCRSMTHWLSWRTALSASAAREHIRIGHALEDLLLVRAAFARGELSYSQVRAVSRVAVASTEANLVELARAMTASQLDRLVARYRGVRAVTTETAQERRERRGMHSYLDDDGMRVTIIRQPPEDGECMMRAVDAVVEAGGRQRKHAVPAPEPGIDPEVDSGLFARRADALLQIIMASGRHDDDGSEEVKRRDVHGVLVVVHTQPEILSGEEDDGICHVERGPGIAPETARRLACDADVIISNDEPDGTSTLGRRSRRVPPAMRRALKLRDKACVFPGCDATTGTDAHHVRPWARGGPTTLANLAVLCSFHHHRVHEGGYTMRPTGRDSDRRQRWEFLRPDGRPIPAVSEPRGRFDGLPAACDDIEPDACVPDWDGGGVDQAWVIDGLLQAEGLLLDATPPDRLGEPTVFDGRSGIDGEAGRAGQGGCSDQPCRTDPPDCEGQDGPSDQADCAARVDRDDQDDMLLHDPLGDDGRRRGWCGRSWPTGAAAGARGDARSVPADRTWPNPWPSPWSSGWSNPWPEHRDDDRGS